MKYITTLITWFSGPGYTVSPQDEAAALAHPRIDFTARVVDEDGRGLSASVSVLLPPTQRPKAVGTLNPKP